MVGFLINVDMTEQSFGSFIGKYAEVIAEIKDSAHQLHESVNQTYDDVHPYGYHLDMVADSVYKYGHCVCRRSRCVAFVLWSILSRQYRRCSYDVQ